MKEYTKEQIKDIKEREAKALEMLKELELTPAAQIYKINAGNDIFADKVQPYLQDLKYKDEKSDKEVEKPVETV